MYKLVNNVRVRMSDEEIESSKSRQKNNQKKRKESENRSLKISQAQDKIYAAAGLTEEESDLLRGL